MKDVATTCVLRAVNASKYVCVKIQRPTDPLAGFEGGKDERE